MDGFAAVRPFRAGEIMYLKTVDMVAVSGSTVAPSGRSKSPDAMSGWDMSMKGPVRTRQSA